MDKGFRQKGPIPIPIMMAIIAVVIAIAGAGAIYAYVEYDDVSDRIARAERLSDEGSHTEAIELLEETRRSWLVRSQGVKEAEIIYALRDSKVRKNHQDIYVRSLDKLEATEWNDAITLLQNIPDASFYHDKALRKIEESKRGLLEEELGAERTARREAEQFAAQEGEARQRAEQVAATEEAGKKEAERAAAREEEARKVAEQVAQQEEQARKVAELIAAREEEARKVAELIAAREDEARKAAELIAAREEEARKAAELRAVIEAVKRAEEEVARKEAEQSAAQERLAKEQQQREAEFLAVQQEKARILELAKTHPLIKAAVSGELKFYIEPLPNYAGTGVPLAVESLAGDFSSWKPYGATVRRVYSSSEADLTIAWIRDFGAHTIGQSIVRIHIKVGLGTNNCLGDWRAFDANTVRKILWHELGHSMGYGHSSNPNNVMYYQTATRFAVEQEISEVISGGWSWWFLLCDSGAYTYSFEGDNSVTGFNLFVIPPEIDPKNFSSAGGSFYVGCGKERVYRYSGSCNVASGARIYITNLSPSSAIRFNGNIVRTTTPPWPDMTWDDSEFQYDTAQLREYQELFR